MPELPEVETVKRGLEKSLVKSQITSMKISYSPIVKNNTQDFSKTLKKATFLKFFRHGKYLFINLKSFSGEEIWVLIHLRMTGQLFLLPSTTIVHPKLDKHVHLTMKISNGENLYYRDIRKFGMIKILNIPPKEYIKQKKLGEDALIITLESFQKIFINRKKSIKATLLDQNLITGIGNIYADESLFRAGILPDRTSNSLSKTEIISLYNAIKEVLTLSIKKKGTTFSDYITSYGEQGKFQMELLVYHRQNTPCLRCKTKIIKSKVAGRGTHFCPKCQK